MANLDWATDVDLAFFSPLLETKRLNSHKHITDWCTRKPAQEPLWNLNSRLLLGFVCTTVLVILASSVKKDSVKILQAPIARQIHKVFQKRNNKNSVMFTFTPCLRMASF